MLASYYLCVCLASATERRVANLTARGNILRALLGDIAMEEGQPRCASRAFASSQPLWRQGSGEGIPALLGFPQAPDTGSLTAVGCWGPWRGHAVHRGRLTLRAAAPRMTPDWSAFEGTRASRQLPD